MKRTSQAIHESELEAQKQKKLKVHPFFKLTDERKHEKFWQPTINRSCKHAVTKNFINLPKVAAFDLDGTIITPREGKKFPNSATDWQWWRKQVPEQLQALHRDKFAIVLFTNQRISGAKLASWVEKIPLIAEKLKDVPFRLFAATDSDAYRKPLPGMWWELEKIYKADNVEIDQKLSFYVGDAAGRPGDHSASDRKFALNIGLKFYTPEEYFLSLTPAPYVLKGFDPSSLLRNDPTPSPATDILFSDFISEPEIMVFVGSPGLGKTSFYRKYFEPQGYVHVNQDKLKRRERCWSLAEECIRSGKPCVIDNTNRNGAARKAYIDLARKLSCRIRCLVFPGTVDLAWHNVLYRTWMLSSETKSQEPLRQLVPRMVIESFFKEYQEPSEAEGFQGVKHISWGFVGSEEQRRRWGMWLEL